jgi:hypothetical protein
VVGELEQDPVIQPAVVAEPQLVILESFVLQAEVQQEPEVLEQLHVLAEVPLQEAAEAEAVVEAQVMVNHLQPEQQEPVEEERMVALEPQIKVVVAELTAVVAEVES